MAAIGWWILSALGTLAGRVIIVSLLTWGFVQCLNLYWGWILEKTWPWILAMSDVVWAWFPSPVEGSFWGGFTGVSTEQYMGLLAPWIDVMWSWVPVNTAVSAFVVWVCFSVFWWSWRRVTGLIPGVRL